MKEEWRTHPDLPGYQVSDRGRVRRSAAGKAARVGHILKPGIRSPGYAVVGLSRDSNVTTKLVHMLVLETFVGPKPPDKEARHLDGVKSNNALSNLAWGTHAENYADRVRHGGGNHGSRHGMSKLTEEKVIAIRELARNRERHVDIGIKFGVSRANVGMIVRGARWAHI